VQTDWANGRRSATSSGSNPYENVLAPYNVNHLEQLWTTTGGSYLSNGPPGVAVASGLTIAENGHSGTIVALRPDGSQAWSQALSSSFFSGPAPATGSGLVIASSTDGKVHAYNLANGAPKWTSAGPSDTGNGSPVVTGSEVLVPAPSALVAYNLFTGGVLWSYPGPCTGNVSTPAISAGTVLFTCTQSGGTPVVVVLGTDGSFRHWFSAAAGTTSAPAIAGGSVYLLLGGSLAGYSLSGYNPKWSDTPPFTVSTDPAAGDGIVVTCGSGGIWAVNVADGSVRFSDPGFGCTASPVIADGVIYMPRNGDIVMYDEYGDRLGRLGTGGDAGPPAVVDGSVYVEDSLSGVDRFAIPGGANPSSAHARPKLTALHPNRALKPYRSKR
jgi:hypothetical protein